VGSRVIPAGPRCGPLELPKHAGAVGIQWTCEEGHPVYRQLSLECCVARIDHSQLTEVQRDMLQWLLDVGVCRSAWIEQLHACDEMHRHGPITISAQEHNQDPLGPDSVVVQMEANAIKQNAVEHEHRHDHVLPSGVAYTHSHPHLHCDHRHVKSSHQ